MESPREHRTSGIAPIEVLRHDLEPTLRGMIELVGREWALARFWVIRNVPASQPNQMVKKSNAFGFEPRRLRSHKSGVGPDFATVSQHILHDYNANGFGSRGRRELYRTDFLQPKD